MIIEMFDKIKTKLKNSVPVKFMYFYYLLKAHIEAHYDLKRRVYDKVFNDNKTDKVRRDLTLLYHIVEKGLTMPVPRPGFGRQVVLNLCKVVILHEKMQLPLNELEFTQSVTVLKEYVDFHNEIGYKLDDELTENLYEIINKFGNIKGFKQISTTNAEYFKHTTDNFENFCNSRYSVRNYTKDVIPLEILHQCIELAQKSPSFCNRQPTRVYLVKSPEKKKAILEIQNGNRGFGELSETLIVLTSVISVTKDIHERFENHLNGGMFAMTLLNALHFYKIAACALNWSVDKSKDITIRQILNIPENEVVLLIISCGYPPQNFMIASSPRKASKDITKAFL